MKKKIVTVKNPNDVKILEKLLNEGYSITQALGHPQFLVIILQK